MKRTMISQITEPQEQVLLKGFVAKIRAQKSMIFVVLRDASASIQIAFERESSKELDQAFMQLKVESVIEVQGKVVKSAAKSGGFEVVPTSITVLSMAKTLPVAKDSKQEVQMDYRWIELRDKKKSYFFKLQTTLSLAIREWASSQHFVEIHTPHITAHSSEGGSEVFEIKNYFGQKSYLTQSSQLFKQCAMASGLERTVEIGPCFRANPSFTSRHATEFYQVDVELSFIDSHHDVMDMEESMIKYVTKQIEQKHGAEIKEMFGVDFKAQQTDIPRIQFKEVLRILKEELGQQSIEKAKDLDPQSEKLICKYVKEKYGSDFVFVTDYPAKSRAFYTMGDEADPKYSKSFDLLYKGLEITSGAQREHRVEKLKELITSKGIDAKQMEFYTQFFEYGCPPHGGFGLGFERFMAKILEQPNIKDVIFLFRGPSRITP